MHNIINMARRRGEDLLEQILILFNNSAHWRTRKLMEKQRKIIEALQKKQRVSRNELAKLIGEDFTKEPRNSKEYRRKITNFYTALSPLLGNCIYSEREGKETYYSLNYFIFKAKLDAIKKAGQRYFKGEGDAE